MKVQLRLSPSVVMRSFVIALSAVAMLLCATVSQAQVTTGTIAGTVSDSSGAVLPGAKIEILNEGTGAVRTVTTAADGHYSAPSLPVGNYKLTVGMAGFQTEVRSGIVLAVGQQAVLDIKMQVGAVTQTLEVTGVAPLVETTESTVSYMVSGENLRDLPLNGRDMSQLILIAPGVNVSNTAGGQAFNGYGARISISGMRGEDNTYLMDGQLIGDFRRHIPAGPSGAMLGLESTQEFQVLTNSFGAQYGRALGGVFNAVSKSGTNEWHGDAYDYLRNDRFDAARWEDNRVRAKKPAFRRNQFGGILGGPIKKDKAFFFVAYESTRQALTLTQTPQTMDADLRRGILKTNGVPNGQTVTVNPAMLPYINQYPLPSPGGRVFGDGTAEYVYSFKQPTVEHFGQARVDFPSLTEKDSFFVRFTGSHSQQPTPYTTAAPVSFPGFTQDSSLGSWLLTLSETHIISPTALNTLRVHFSRVIPFDDGIAPPPGPGVLVTPGQPDPPELTVTGISGFGGGGFATKPTIMTSNRFTYQDDVNWTWGGHSLKFGGFLERFQLNSTKPNRAYGVWTFTSVTAFLQNNATTFRGAIPGYGNYRRGLRNWSFALYLQDDWRVNNKLTVNLGVRWEPYTVPTEVNGLIANLRHIGDTKGTIGGPYWLNKSLGDIGPRAGLAYSPFDSGKTSIRAGFGVLYAPNDPNLYYNQMDRMPPLGFDFTLPIPAGFNRFPDAVAELAALNTESLARTGFPLQSPAYSVPYDNNKDTEAVQWNFNIQQQIGASSLFSIGYVGSRGMHLLSVGDLNIPRAVFDGVSLAMPNNAILVNPAWPSILQFANNTSSKYNGLLVSYQKRFSRGWTAQFSYTWSKTFADADSGQTGGGVTTGGGRQKYPNDTRAQWGLSGYDFRQIVSFNYSYQLPFAKDRSGVLGKILSGWQTTGGLSIRAGQPINLSVGVSTVAPPGGLSLNQLAVTPRSPNAIAGVKPKIYGGPNESKDPSGLQRYFEPKDYAFPNTRELGNLARNTMIGPGLIAWNPALFKKTSITERTSLEFRTEMFNVLNRPNFGQPAASLYNATGVLTPSAGTISSTIGTPRQIQFALKLIW